MHDLKKSEKKLNLYKILSCGGAGSQEIFHRTIFTNLNFSYHINNTKQNKIDVNNI